MFGCLILISTDFCDYETFKTIPIFSKFVKNTLLRAVFATLFALCFIYYRMTGRKNRALQVPLFVPYKALENFLKALYGTTEGTCSAQFFRPVMTSIENALSPCIDKTPHAPSS